MKPKTHRSTANRAARGFTLTELLIVIAIIGILAGLAYSGLTSTKQRAKITATRALISAIDSGMQMFRTDFGHTPYNAGGETTNDRERIRLWLLGLTNAGEKDDSVRDNQLWNGPYVEVKIEDNLEKDKNYVFADAWRNPIYFEMKDPIFNIDRWDIWSLGPDMEGTTGMSVGGSTYDEKRTNFKNQSGNADTVGNW